MTRLEWNKPGDKKFQAGVDRGVFYPQDETIRPVAWNGLTGVVVTPEGTSLDPVYQDGYVQAFDVSPGRFKAVLDCFDYPDEFGQIAVGEAEYLENSGFYLSNQEFNLFNLSWRSGMGNDLKGSNAHYKIHLVFDAMATPSDQTYATVSEETEPANFSFNLDAIPQQIEGKLPTAHFVIDTRKIHPKIVADIETILYGDDNNDPKMFSFDDIEGIIQQEPPAVAENLFPNPSFDGPIEEKVYATNLVHNPFGGNLSNTERFWGFYDWNDFGSGGSGNVTKLGAIDVDGELFPSYQRKLWTTATTDSSVVTFGFTEDANDLSKIPENEGLAVSFRVGLYWRSSYQANSQIVFTVLNADGEEIYQYTDVQEQETIEEWQYHSFLVNKAVSSLAKYYKVYHELIDLDTTTASVGFVDVTGGMVAEDFFYADFFFGGDISMNNTDLVLDSKWSGSTDSSISELFYQSPSGIAGGVVALSSTNALNGDYSAYPIPSVGLSQPSIEIANQSNLQGMTLGQTYRFTAYVTLTNELLEGYSPGLMFYLGNTVVDHTAPANTPGVPQQISLDVELPVSSAAEWMVVLRADRNSYEHGFYFDKVSVVPIDQTEALESSGGYFDGETRIDPWTYGEWSGEPNESSSYLHSFDFSPLPSDE